MDDNKQKALTAALGQIERQFGKGSIMRLGDSTALDIDFIPTGSLGLDIALGIGGLPCGRIVEIYGPESSGKTTLTLQVVAEAQRMGKTCAFIDAEHALDPVYAKKLGVNVDDLLVSQPDTGEQRWMHEQESALLSLRGTSEPVIASGGVIFGSGAGKVSVLIADKGVMAWDAAIAVPKGATDLSRMVDVDATPIVVDGTVYAIAFNGELVALELRTGRVMWKREYASFRDMVIEGNTIYLVDSVGKIFAIDRRNGLEQWAQLGLHKHFLTGPAVYKDYLAIGDVEGNLFWLDKNTGEFVAQESYGSGFYVQGVSSADELVIQTRDGELSLIRLP